jgi:dihydroorotate dehydrogenase
MSWLYRGCVRPWLFSFDSEEIHDRTLGFLGGVSRQPVLCEAMASILGAGELPVDLLGLRFPNPVGLAAGMDKRAAAVPAWEAMGFGFTELGGVTWHAQPGNPAPRMFRVIPDEALVNRMGFNNPGAGAMAQALAAWKHCGRWPRHPVGINLGKSKATPLELAAEDYAQSFRALRAFVDFFVVNVSSPNTPGLRALQDKAALDEILAALQEEQGEVRDAWCVVRDDGQRPHDASHAARIQRHHVPVLVKIAPDLSFAALDEILELIGPRWVSGIVATNTTIARPPGTPGRLRAGYSETGGLSGRPLRQRSTEVIRHLRRQTRGMVPIMGVGGIFTAEDAWEKITAGASLVQVYTGLVYEGPSIARDIVAGLKSRLERAGLKRLSEAVGIAA